MNNDSKPSVKNLRKDYRLRTLDMTDTLRNPVDQFDRWFEEAVAAEVIEPNAMTLATATLAGIPAARIVLLKGYDKKGFVFYTNFDSQKGIELTNNPNAALVFCWLELQRQVRISGRVEKLSSRASKKYFQTRPKSSQIGAWVSPQSQIISDRSILEKREAELREKYKAVDQLPLPPNWGGFRVVPLTVEFWQGRTSRLHDRIQYQKSNNRWRRNRLAP